jgi:hypothetical protein
MASNSACSSSRSHATSRSWPATRRAHTLARYSARFGRDRGRWRRQASCSRWREQPARRAASATAVNQPRRRVHCVRRARSFDARFRPPVPPANRQSKSLTQQLQQLGEVRRHPPRLIARQPIWSPSGATHGGSRPGSKSHEAEGIWLGARNCDLTVGCVRFGANGWNLDKSDLHPGPDVLQRHRCIAEHDDGQWNEQLGVERRFGWRQFERRSWRAAINPQRPMWRRFPH